MKPKAASLRRYIKLITFSKIYKKKRERTQINKIINEKSYNQHHRNTKHQKRQLQLYASIIDNLEEMAKFLERYILPRMNQEEMETTNRPITTDLSQVLRLKM